LVLKNVAWLSVASAAVKPVWFAFITVLCARVLGAEGYGALNTALSLGALAFAFTDLGVNQYTVREVAGDPGLASRFLTNFVVLRLGLFALAAAGALAAAAVLGYEPTLMLAVGFACLYYAAQHLRDYFHSFFQAFENLRLQSYSVVLEKILVLAAGATLLLSTEAAEWTLLGMAAGMTLTACVVVAWGGRRIAPFRWAEFDPSFITRTLRPLLPFGLASLFSMFFYRVDTVMVEGILGLTAAGQYGLAFRIVEALNLLPLIVVHAAVYPRLSRLTKEGAYEESRSLIATVSVGLLVLSALIALAIALPAPTLVRWISPDPELQVAAETLRVLVWAFPLTCLRTTFYVTLLAIHEQRYIAWTLGFGVVFNVGLNALLIPELGILGAAAATIASEIVLLAAYAFRYRRRLPGSSA
jgi:O-antigen/teichoic acid export membrane protein